MLRIHPLAHFYRNGKPPHLLVKLFTVIWVREVSGVSRVCRLGLVLGLMLIFVSKIWLKYFRPAVRRLVRCRMWWLFQEGRSGALQSTETMQVDGDRGQVQFKPLHKNNEGKYTCKAVNDVGEASSSGKLTVLGQYDYGCQVIVFKQRTWRRVGWGRSRLEVWGSVVGPKAGSRAKTKTTLVRVLLEKKPPSVNRI